MFLCQKPRILARATTATAGRSFRQRHNVAVVSLSHFSSFSKESVTTKVSPIVNHGPHGSGGTVVGFSKHDGVREAFEENFARRLELGSQLVVYEKGEKIIDLYGYAPEMEGYDGDTLQGVYSSGKNMEAIAMAMLVDRGLVSYDDLVTKHWPEFGANGKDTITIADVMRHSGGVPFIVDCDPETYPDVAITITQKDVRNGIEPLEEKICASGKYPPPSHPGMMYHAHTRGWLVNGILRRVDPSGRSLGHFMKEEIVDPLSGVGDEVKFFNGISMEDQKNYKFANSSLGNPIYNGTVEIFPSLLGFGDQCTAELAKMPLIKDVRRGLLNATKWDDNPLKSLYFPDTPEGRAMEYSSVGMVANARSMAIVNATTMAGDGSFNGVRILSKEAVSNSMGGIESGVDFAAQNSLSFSRGGYGSFNDMLQDFGSHQTRVYHPDDVAAYRNLMGWFGVSGSQSLVDREREVAIAYCNNAFGFNLLGGPRTRRILLELQNAMAE